MPFNTDALGARPASAQPTTSDALVPRPAPRAEVRALTGLRGIAALMVAVYHIDPELRSLGAFGRAIGRGYLWVDLFFVLSGFVLALNYGARFERGWSAGSWRDFLLRRVARIYPLYAVLLLGALAYMAMGWGQSFAMPLLPYPHLVHPLAIKAANVVMVQSWGVGPSVDGTAWSLSAEWAAYVLFPLLAGLALFSRGRTAFALAALAAAGIVATATLTGIDHEAHSGALDAYDGRTIEPVLRCLSGFVLGLLMFRLAQGGRVSAWLARDDVLAALLLLTALGFAFAPDDLWIYPLFPPLVLGLYGNRGAIGRMLGGGAVYWLGLVSYSIYLVHPYLVLPKRDLATLLAGALGHVPADIAASVAAFTAVLVLSGASYRLIEEPGRRALNRAARTWIKRPATPLSSV